jgi:hypothetical protein
MHDRRQPPASRYGLRGSPVDEPKNERQNRTDQGSRSDWKIERASRLHLLRLGGVTHDEGRELGLDTFWTHVFDLRHSPSLPSILALGLVLLSSGGDQKRNSPLWSR